MKNLLQQLFPPDWTELLKEQEEELIKIGTYVAERRKVRNVFPKSEEIFRAFHETPLDKVRCVLLGMDPYANMYKGEPVACGLSFATRNNDYQPPSLRILRQAACEDLGEGDLDWENLPSQGVLLLNAALTVEEKLPGSHLKIWENFTLNLLKKIQFNNTGLIFVLLGKDAQKFRPSIVEAFHHVIVRSHPVSSVYSGKPWEHGYLFSEINKIIYSQNKEIIKWQK
jgi:uracil-DNA glycosylase